MTDAFEPIKLLLFIVNRGEGLKIEEYCTKNGLYSHLLVRGRGTADNKTLTMLGLGETEKDIVIITAARSRGEAVMSELGEMLRLNERGRGIAISIPLSSVASQLHSYYALAGLDEPEETETDNDNA